MVKEFGDKLTTSSVSRPNKSSDELFAKLKWNPGGIIVVLISWMF